MVQLERKKVAGILPDVPSSSIFPFKTFKIKHFSVSSNFRMDVHISSLLLHQAQVYSMHYACSLAESQEIKETLKERKESK